MTKTITFTKEDMSKDFMDVTGCPIYTALAREGVPVMSVGGGQWTDHFGNNYEFSRRLHQASNLLVDTDIPIVDLVDRKKMVRLRKKLVGKSYRVTY